MSDQPRRLVLLRHATAVPGGSGPDEERSLTDVGIDEAARAGAWLKDEGFLGEVVLCSPALRTRQTWATIQEETGHGVLIDMEPAIYEAGVDDLLAVIRDLDATHPDARTVVVVGHVPGIPALAHELTAGRGDQGAVKTLSRGFVPASAAVVILESAWGDLGRGVGELEHVRAGSV